MRFICKVVALTLLIGINSYGSAVIFSGSNVKTLKQNIDLNGVVTIQSGSVDPSSTATSANEGSLYLSTNGKTYIKQDSGSTTNWLSVDDILTPVSIANGGTGQTSELSAINALGMWNTTSFLAGTSVSTNSGVTGSVNIGYAAGENSTNVNNVFIGYAAGGNATTAYDNVCVGYGSCLGASGWSGAANMAVGYNSLYRISGATNYNMALGYQALQSVTTGAENSGIGLNAGTTITTGADNTFIGGESDATANNLTNATAIGYKAKVGESNAVVLGGTGSQAVDVGIGTTTPAATLHLETQTDSTVGAIIQGHSATQSSDLTNWENSAGTVLSYIDNQGVYHGYGGSGIYTVTANQIQNSGWETDTSHWTASAGTYTRVTASADVGSGTGAAQWSSNALNDTFKSDLVSIPAGMYGHNGAASINAMVSGSTATLEVSDGTNIIASTTLPLSTGYQRTTINFVFPSSGSLQMIVVAGSSQIIYMDDAYLGSADQFNLGSSAIISGWTAYTPTLVGFGTTTNQSFYYRQVGDTIEIQGFFTTGAPTATQAQIPLPSNYTVGSSMPINSTNYAIVGEMGITDTGNSQFHTIIAAPGNAYLNIGLGPSANNLLAVNGSSVVTSSVSVSLFARVQITQLTGSGTTLNASQTPAYWSGNFPGSSNCTWTNSGTASFGDFTQGTHSSCNLTANPNVANLGTVTQDGTLPGITFTPSATGVYRVCADVNSYNNVSTSDFDYFDITDGTHAFNLVGAQGTAGTMNLCGDFSGTSGTALNVKIQGEVSAGTETIGALTATYSLNWTITMISPNGNAPLLVNSNINPRAGVTESADAIVTCSSSSSIVQQGGSWISSVGNISSSGCTLTLAAGIFSATPSCVASVDAASAQTTVLTIHPTSSTSATVYGSGSPSSFNADIHCSGPH